MLFMQTAGSCTIKGSVLLIALTLNGCRSAASNGPALTDVQSAFSAALTDQAIAERMLDPALASAVTYELERVTVDRFVTAPMQHPGEPGWTALIAANGSYRVSWPKGSPVAVASGTQPAEPKAPAASAGPVTTVVFKRSFPLRLTYEAGQWVIPK